MEDINFDELDDKTKLIVSKMEKVINDKNSEILSKNKEIEDLKNELAFLRGQIISKNRKMFGKSSEQVDDNQLSLAIGKEGQNVRLAAKLTNWKIDIKSKSQAEAAQETTETIEE